MLLCLAVLPCLAPAALGQEEDEDEFVVPDLRPGLAAEYRAGERRFQRVDAAVAFAWNEAAPDLRLPAGPFSVAWRGQLFVGTPGKHRLRLHTAGEVRLIVAGQTLLEASRPDLGWLDAAPIELDYGYHPLTIEYRRADEPAAIGLYWESPQFRLEPIADRYLFHDPGDAPARGFERGQELSRGLRCAACHDIPGEAAPLDAPALDQLSGNIERGWLVAWLSEEHPRAADGPRRRMPRLHLKPDEAAAVAAYLLAAPADNDKDNDVAAAMPDADAITGQTLFRTLGCLACHRVHSLGDDGLFGGGDLTEVARKRPAGFFARWLAEPERINARHRMPVFELSDEERNHLAAYLATLGAATSDSSAPAAAELNTVPETAKRERGRELLRSRRCAACHQTPDTGMPPVAKIPLRSIALEEGALIGCLGDAIHEVSRPEYDLSAEDRAALGEYLRAAMNAPAARPQPLDGRQLLAERGCLNCHARENATGMAALLPDLVAADAALAPLLPALAPPPLSGVGDKLHDEALSAAIARRGDARRPWLLVRMPRFRLADDELAALVSYFIAADRLPETGDEPSTPSAPEPSELALRQGGGRLVTADGFGCVSCHQIGDTLPQPATLAARGPSLSLLERRVRRSWFERFVRQPARIAPRMEMPSIQLPARGVLGERLDDQLAAVWHVLNVPGFQPPPADAVRVVRTRNAPGETESAVVLTDVLEVEGRQFIKPLLIGLSNRHNVLFDLAENRLAAWWPGDAARQRTRGKSWYWEAAGAPLWGREAGGVDSVGWDEQPEMRLVIEGETLAPIAAGQFATEFDVVEWIEGGVRFRHRLRFTTQATATIQVTVTQEVTAVSDADADVSRHGFRRRLEFAGAPAGAELLLRFPVGEAIEIVGQSPLANDESLAHSVPLGPFTIRLSAPRAAFHVDALSRSSAQVVLQSPDASESVILQADYLTFLPADHFLNPLPEAFRPPAAQLEVVPGYAATRLPLPADIMPTGFAWHDDGRLLFTSLKGQVHVAEDTDADGLEDALSVFVDGLAAPYGLAVRGDVVDVINKYALLRLRDADGDGRADNMQTLASGWGHTADYHDWAVGLERDGEGRYYVALPCQQDERDATAAHLRGTALVLSPREPTADDPRPFGLEVLCGGLRFPMGLARSRGGALFASDNQGNYNPFNELNHLLPGTRYGFINRREQQPGFAPPFEPAAVELPHPWTRSVNGICFLDTPDALLADRGSRFGPFEGHLLGCEYDTRRLVRMSLQQVGHGFQGAVYPFSVEPPAGSEPLEGPIVCGVSPAGDVYVGNIRDSGWGGGANTGSLVRLRPTGALPLGIAEVRAAADGFLVDFTGPVDADRAARPGNYLLESYRRIATADYGGPDVDRRAEALRGVEVSSDARRVTLRLAEMRPGFVYELRVRRLVPEGTTFFPAEAHYTLRRAVE